MAPGGATVELMARGFGGPAPAPLLDELAQPRDQLALLRQLVFELLDPHGERRAVAPRRRLGSNRRSDRALERGRPRRLGLACGRRPLRRLAALAQERPAKAPARLLLARAALEAHD